MSEEGSVRVVENDMDDDFRTVCNLKKNIFYVIFKLFFNRSIFEEFEIFQILTRERLFFNNFCLYERFQNLDV